MKGISALIAAISALIGTVALTRQSLWQPDLRLWLCEGAPPPSPSIVFSLQNIEASQWLTASAGPLLLLALFLATYRGQRWLFFWAPIWALDLTCKAIMWQASYEPWGHCGLRRDLVASGLMFEAVLVSSVVLICLLAPLLRRSFPKDQVS